MTTDNAVVQFLENEVEGIYQEAMMLADVYWDQFNADQQEARAEKKSKALAKLGTRVRRMGMWVSMEWMRAKFYGPVGGRQRKWAYIPRGSNFKIPIRALGTTTEWERQNFPLIEEKYAVLRRRQQALKEMLKAYKAYTKLHDDKTYRMLLNLNKTKLAESAQEVE